MARLARFIFRSLPAALITAAVVGLLGYLVYARATWWRYSDEANLREWLDEARAYRKTLPELVRDYLEHRDEVSRDALREQLKAVGDPTRVYRNQLLLFPDIYRLEVSFPDQGLDPVVWEPAPGVRPPPGDTERTLTYPLVADGRAVLHCDYRLHAFNKSRRDEEEVQTVVLAGSALLVALGGLGAVWVSGTLRREREQERERLQAAAEVEHATRVNAELRGQLLEQELEVSRAKTRAAEAEKSSLELQSQLYASIGVMAGSYAHNIKNLLVRPNELLSRLESNGVAAEQRGMIAEVKQMLGTVTERLQQILKTVRRDPSKPEMARLDLNALTVELHRTWAEMARDKWKAALVLELAGEPLPVTGDESHLQQMAENLLFNARDATFEMRNHLRDEARRESSADPKVRQQALLTAAAWKGQIVLRTRRGADGSPTLEVGDNGVGMTDEVRQRCTQAHFSTKRNNALFEGLTAGMGLGLSFVTVILEHHRATLDVESEPLRGTTMRVTFLPAEVSETQTAPAA